MIGIQIKGSNFRGILSYHNKKIEEGVAKILETNMSGRNVNEMTKEFNLIKQMRSGLSKGVYHVSLSLPPNERLKEERFLTLTKEYLNAMGFDDNQYVIYQHDDQDHYHVHAVVNRVKLSGEVVSDSNDYKRSESVIRKLEIKYGLSAVISSSQSKRKALTKNELDKSVREGKIPIKLIIQNALDEACNESLSTDDFIIYLNSKKVDIKFNISKTTKRVSGISFSSGGIIFKGSNLGKIYSWNSIKNKINYEQNRDYEVICENNLIIDRIGNNNQREYRVDSKTQRQQNVDKISYAIRNYYNDSSITDRGF